MNELDSMEEQNKELYSGINGNSIKGNVVRGGEDSGHANGVSAGNTGWIERNNAKPLKVTRVKRY